jgi:hypothetical protein
MHLKMMGIAVFALTLAGLVTASAQGYGYGGPYGGPYAGPTPAPYASPPPFRGPFANEVGGPIPSEPYGFGPGCLWEDSRELRHCSAY